MNEVDGALPEGCIRQWLGDRAELVGLLPGGSPERSVKRGVFQADTGEMYVLEGVSLGRRRKREAQAALLETLKSGGQRVLPWMKTRDGSSGIECQGLFWQCRQYAHGCELDRETYGEDEWRGAAAATWLRQLWEYDIPCNPSHVFYITDYIHHLMHLIEHDSKALYGDLSDVLAALKFSPEEERELPLTLCHGDYHPGNVLWGEHNLLSVIDWEFWGWKPQCYDVANMLGCIWNDNPDWMDADMSRAFLATLQLPPNVEKILIRYVVALRFAWMREWWQHKMKDMIIQELDFMWILLSIGNK